ncbi:MBL fold metallo-hydrolase [Pseudomonas asiatica]|uniref:MBL fold metallo-hydrolase n=1 Tax=Pseudomonas asiatica TaxID=2219225 RepID=UPI003877F3BE
MKTKSKSVLFALASVCAVVGLSLNIAHASEKAKVTVLYEGHVAPIEGKKLLPWSSHDGARSLSTSTFVIESGGKVLVGDPGIVRRNDWPKVMDKLAKMGITPEDVDYVWISHHHPDHVQHLGAFPNAPLVDFWSVYTDELWEDHPDNFEVIPGVKVVRTPGHTDEDSSLLVDTDEGVMLITHMWWHNDMTPVSDPVAEDLPALDRNRREMLPKADLLFPLHGKVMKNPFKKKEWDGKPYAP